MKSRILLVDDETNVLSALTRALFDEPYEISTATGGEQALEMMKEHGVKVVVSDERMIGMQGTAFLARVRALYPGTVRILLTGQATMEAAVRAVNEGEVYRFFTKPWNDIELKFAIRSAVEKHDLESENRRLLRTVKNQALEIKILEKRYPGITRLQKDSRGSLIVPDMPEAEIARMLEECENEVR